MPLLCVAEGFLLESLYIDSVGIETFGLHVLILCVPEAYLSQLHNNTHNEDMETFGLNGLILYLS